MKRAYSLTIARAVLLALVIGPATAQQPPKVHGNVEKIPEKLLPTPSP